MTVPNTIPFGSYVVSGIKNGLEGLASKPLKKLDAGARFDLTTFRL